jgi:hypothetical protein
MSLKMARRRRAVSPLRQLTDVVWNSWKVSPSRERTVP